MTQGAERSVFRYYGNHLDNYTASKVDSIKNLTAKERKQVNSDLKDAKALTKKYKEEKDWRLTTALVETRIDNKKSLIFIDSKDHIKARRTKTGRFVRVPKRFKTY